MREMPRDYVAVLADLKRRIGDAQSRAALAVSRELIALYWQVGGTIVRRQAGSGWGDAVVERLAHDLRKAFPTLQGFSPRNIWRMRAFYLAWSGVPRKLTQPVSESRAGVSAKKLPQAVSEIPWGHNILLLQQLEKREHRLWYAEQARSHGWSRLLLQAQIAKKAHARQGKPITNFARTLPPSEAALAQQALNATLEAMARALFQSWFVDFDPVRAKLDGRKPDGLDKATAALFPAAFQDSPLGPIPRGWEVGRLDDALTLQRGFDLPTSDRTHGVYPVMAASGPNGCHDKFMVHGPGVTTGRSGVLGKVFFIHGDFWPLNTSLWVKEFKRVSPAYAFHLLRGLDFEIFNAGSAVPTLNRNHVHNLPVLMPPKPIVDALDGQVMPLMKQQQANEDQSRTLATLRDTLLPKLLSGELRIRN
jgi:type I restriction enzyme S subunit